MNFKKKLAKRVLSVVIVGAMAANFCTIMPFSVFATVDDTIQKSETKTFEQCTGHRYQLFDIGLSWEEAKAYCEELGGHLATITTEKEQLDVEHLFSTGTKNSYWVGACRNGNGDWSWINDEEFSYSNWGENEPDNFIDIENALMLYRVSDPDNKYSQTGPGMWNDLCSDCTCQSQKFFGKENFGFICEWDGTVSKHTYQRFDYSLSWTEAEAFCEELGGHLATITSAEEQEYIAENFVKDGIKNTFYIGMYRDSAVSDWKWITNEATDYFNWDQGEPNYTYEHYVHMYRDIHKPGTWNNTTNNEGGNQHYSSANAGFICEWEEDAPEVIIKRNLKNYAFYSASDKTDISLSGWKTNITGNVYTGANFKYSGSELKVDGRIDTVGNIETYGWKIDIDEKNEGAEAVSVINLDEDIHFNAQPYEYIEGQTAYVEDKNVINSSIKVPGNIEISGTTFDGDCYIIANGDITYNINEFNTTGRVFLYSQNGNITINGTNIDFNGAMYAPNGNVFLNTYNTNITGFVWGDSIAYSGSQLNITGANFDMLEPSNVVKTYTIDDDFNEGTLNGLALATPNELCLAANNGINIAANENVYGDIENGKGVKVSCITDKAVITGDGDTLGIRYDLSGFGKADVNDNPVDLILVVDESGSMSGTRMTNTKASAKEIISKMKANDRCAVVGFTSSSNLLQDLTSDKDALNTAVDNLRASGGTSIYSGLDKALAMFKQGSDDNHQKYIILLSDGEDGNPSKSLVSATNAGQKNIRIFAMMIGSGTLQMQNIAINSNGIYKNAPTTDDISRIMSYFASEVFNVAGRNTTFKTTVRDKNAVDISNVTPAPSKVTENENGSTTLEWNFDRITIDEAKSINIPLSVSNSSNGFADLLEDTSCVYYDRSGKPNIVYADDVILPISSYVESGNWSAVFDSDRDTVNWKNIYWNGERNGNGKLIVTACCSNDGVNFSAPVTVNNYQEISGLSGRFIKISVDMTRSSDGKSPRLYDITVVSEGAFLPESINTPAEAKIFSKDKVKINTPLNLRTSFRDNCLKSDLSVKWSCENDNVKFSDASSQLTSVKISETGSFDIKCTINDGEKEVTAVKTVVCEPADSYADIGPEAEAEAPKISAVLPEYADKNEVISGKIEKLNDTEIAWYSVIVNDQIVGDVNDNGEFTVKMPGSDGTFPVVIRAFDWSGKSDVQKYTISVDSVSANASIVPSSKDTLVSSEAYFTVTLKGKNKIKNITYKLNDKEITLPEDGKVIVDTSAAGKTVLTVNGETLTGNTFSATGTINIVEADTTKPSVKISSDKSSYSEGGKAVITVSATDNIAVDKIVVLVDGKEVAVDSYGKFTIDKLKFGDYIITANAYDAAGNLGTATSKITGRDVTKPTVTLNTDKTEINLGDSINVSVIAADNHEVASVALTADSKSVALSADNTAVYTPATVGKHTLRVIVKDGAGNSAQVSKTIVVNEADTISPVVILSFDKDTYYDADDIIVSVSATDNKGVEKTVLLIDDEEVVLDENSTYTIKASKLKDYEITARAYDAAGNEGIATQTVKVNKAQAPEINVSFDKDIYVEGDNLNGMVTATGQRNIALLTADVNGSALEIKEGTFTINDLKSGEYIFKFTAKDEKGLSSTVQKKITVLKKEVSETRLAATIDGLVELDKTAEYAVTASDEIDKSTISVTLNGKKIELSDKLTYEFKAEKLFENEFVLTAKTVTGTELTVKNTVNVYETKKPEVSYVTDKDTYYYDHEDVIFTITTKDESGIKWRRFLYDGVEYPIDENNQVIIKDLVVAPHSMVLMACDNCGNVRAVGSAFYVVEVGTSIEDMQKDSQIFPITPDGVITAPTLIVGNADGENFDKYRLEYISTETGKSVVIKESTTPVTNGIIGEFDPTVIHNGPYTIKLTVWDKDGKPKVDESSVSVEGNMKIGNFSMSFQDLEANTAGATLTFVRTYDSRDRNEAGDFGYGWNMATNGVSISTNCDLQYGWNEEYNMGSFSYSPDKPHIVSVDWGNGQIEKFAMKLTTTGLSSLRGVNISFKSVDGTGTTLVPDVKLNDWMYGSNGIYDFDEDDFNPEVWTVTKKDGTKYVISKKNGLKEITDKTGNKITFTNNGVKSSSGEGIDIIRDGSGRITSISSPDNRSVKYTYDENGNLSTMTDVTGEVTCFKYDSNHYLTEIIDPRGISVSKNVYDENGRLIKTIDADGNEITYSHNVSGREEIITDRNGGVTRYIYDTNGNVISTTDPMGNTVLSTYDDNGNIASKTDALGNTTTYVCNKDGNISSLTDALGHTVKNEYNTKGYVTTVNAMGVDIIKISYDDKGNTTSTIDALGNSIDYDYDTDGNLSSVTDEIGTYMLMTYDSKGNVVSVTNGAGTKSEFTYDAKGNCTSKTISFTMDGQVKTVTEKYEYDAAGNLIKTIDSDGNITSSEYNQIGKVSAEIDADGRRTSYSYDNLGNLTGIKYADGTTESFTYDREGNNLTATDRLGRTVTMAYDKVGNLISKTYPNSTKTSYEYDANYNLISTTDVNGNITSYSYDVLDRNTSITDALGNTVSFTYNDKSQLSAMTDALGNVTGYVYDDNGNRIETVFADSSRIKSSYDARGRVTSQTDQNGNITEYTYDGADNLTCVKDALGNVTSYGYNEVGNLVWVTDANKNTTKYTYDDFSRVIRTTNALGQTAEATYDACGNILTQTDFGGNLTKYDYDEYDRVSSKTTGEGVIKYTYTQDGKLSTVEDTDGVNKFTYDDMDGLTKIVYSNGNYVEYTYDTSCRLTDVKTAYGTTSYEYDKLDRVSRVVDKNGYATVYTYDKNGNRSEVKYANGITVSYKYDEVNRLISEKALDKQGGLVAQYTYTLGAAGERTAVNEPDRTVEYTYDALYRLTGEKITAGSSVTEYTYTYDSVSNRLTKTENGTKTTYTYNELNQLVKENDTVYKFDKAGNLISASDADKSSAYTYNCENKLIRATVQEGNNVSVEEYEYDFAGNRTVKKSENDYTYYLNDISGSLTQVLAELDKDGNAKCWYTRGTELISQERDGAVSYYLTDGHGSVRQLADGEGNVTDTYVYDAWGNMILSEGETENSYLYCGEQFDNATGLYYLRARYMDLSTGTFISMDTYQGSVFDPVSLHKYLYANANPVMNTDPTGYMAEAIMLGYAGIELEQIAITLKIGLALLASAMLIVSMSDIYNMRLNNLIDWIESESQYENLTSGEICSSVNDEIIGDNIAYSKDAPKDTKNVKWSDKARKQFNKKLPPDWKDKILKAIKEFLEGKSNHNDHPMKGDRRGTRSIDIPQTGPGRGTGRIVYEPIIKYGKIVGMKILELITDHKY